MYNKRSTIIEKGKKELREKELKAAFKVLKHNEGGPVTFHYTKEVTLKNGKTKVVDGSKTIVNLGDRVIKHRTLSDLLVLLRSMQADLNADYFTI